MRNAGGYLLVSGPEGAKEADTFTCGHCNGVVVVKPMCDPADAGGACRICDSHICKSCAARGVCDPLEEKLKRIEASAEARRSYGL